MGFARSVDQMPDPDQGHSNHNHANDDRRVREFFIPPTELGASHSRRLLFLDGHAGFGLGLWVHIHYCRHTQKWLRETCIKKNGFGDLCPVCDYQEAYVDKNTGEQKIKDWYSIYVGSCTVLMLGHPEKYRDDQGKLKTRIDPLMRKYKDKEYFTSFERMNILLKRGSVKYPKALPNIHDMVTQATGAEIPNLCGLVMDTHRSDKQSDNVGDSWSFVTKNDEPLRISEDKFMDFAKYMGAPEDFDPINVQPLDHEELWAPKSYAELRAVLDEVTGMPSKPGSSQQGAPVAGVGYDDVPRSNQVPFDDSDDIPF